MAQPKLAELSNLVKKANDPPLIAVFPSGIPSVIADQTDFPFQFMAPKDNKKNQGAFLYGESDNLRFIGSTHQQYNLAKNNFNYSIGYFDPKKPQRVKLVQAHGVFTVKQMGSGDANGPDDGSIQELEFNTARREVTEQFGARKNKRQLRSQEAGRVNIEADEAALQALDTQLTAINADETFEETLGATEDNIMATHKKSLPPFNLTATNVENIYPFDGMLPKQLWRDLDASKMLALRLDTIAIVKKEEGDVKKTPKKAKKTTNMDDSDDSSSSEDELFSEGDDSDDDDNNNTKNKKGKKLAVAEDADETTSTLRLSVADQALVDALPKFIRIRRDLIAGQIRQAQAVGNAVNKTVLLTKMNHLAFFLVLYRLLMKRRGSPRIGPSTKLNEVLEVADSIGKHIKYALFKGHMEYNDEVYTRVLCWFLTMSLLCSDSFTIDGPYVSEIADALKVPAVQLNKVYMRLGAGVNASGRVRLTAPLKLVGFVKPASGKGKK